MKKVAILQSNYIPWKGYFDLMQQVDVFVIYDEVQYTKNDWRNRNLIKSKNGLEWLTIPVKQDKLSQRIDETVVSTTNWNKKHWNALLANYSKAPYFREYSANFKHLYENIELTNLSSINRAFINVIVDILGVKTQLVDSKELNLSGDKNERLIQAVKQIGGNHYISGPSAKDYLDVGKFNDNNIEVSWVNYEGYKSYPQLHEPFEHRVSILDLLFNTGPLSMDYITER